MQATHKKSIMQRKISSDSIIYHTSQTVVQYGNQAKLSQFVSAKSKLDSSPPPTKDEMLVIAEVGEDNHLVNPSFLLQTNKFMKSSIADKFQTNPFVKPI